MVKGYLGLMLHAHLPFVHHPEHKDFLEEDWLYEAISETYIPLLDIYEKLLNDNINFKITMSITPPLCEMLSNHLLQNRYINHLEKLIELTNKEIYNSKKNKSGNLDAAIMYNKKFKRAYKIFVNKYNKNILSGFKKIMENGNLEIVTCCATHGFLPLMQEKKAIAAQIKIAKNNYKKHFGINPTGIWLAECAYKPEIDIYLKENNIKYFFVDAHGIMLGSPRPKYGVFAPVFTPNKIAAFARDNSSSKQVWSSKEGYPGDKNYREFYRDLGYDADYNYIKPYLHSDGIRRNIGIKYHKITGDVDLNKKKYYNPKKALEMVDQHAGNFMFNRQHQVKHLNTIMDRPPIIISPYDAELFGHWWYEGPDFLNSLIRKIDKTQNDIALITPKDYLKKFKTNQVINVNQSTWGDKGYNEVWLNGSNEWMYKHQHKAEERMIELANSFSNPDKNQLRALNQAARELLLAQSSDWAFIMTTGTMTAYAEKRFKNHIYNFNLLYKQLKHNNINLSEISNLEHKNPIFLELDYRIYQ